MIDKLPSYFKDPHLLAKTGGNEPVLVALSGGADSSALLHLMCELRRERYFPLYAAHVNHGIRTESFGGEADRDQAFCEELCRNLGVELFTCRIDVPAIAESEGKSLETAAREARYDFFASVMRQSNIQILATAHNADDNFETQLFNLCRGCGTAGMCGIPETRPVEGGIAVRPLLSACKSEILELCKNCGIEYVTDSTNLVDDCTRNKLRLNIIPQLKEIFTSPERCGARLALSAKEDNEFISSEAEKLLEEKEKEIKLSSIRSAHPSLSKRAISIAYNRFSGGNLEASHLNILLDFARSEKNGEISLPLRTRAIFENEYMRFETESEQKGPSLSYSVPLSCGMNVIDGTDFAVCISSDRCNDASSENYTAYATASLPKTDQGLLARSRREGDSILCGGMHKKVKKLMCDQKIPTKLRASLPIICQGDEILFVPKCAVADKVKQEKNNGHITVTIYKRNES